MDNNCLNIIKSVDTTTCIAPFLVICFRWFDKGFYIIMFIDRICLGILNKLSFVFNYADSKIKQHEQTGHVVTYSRLTQRIS